MPTPLLRGPLLLLLYQVVPAPPARVEPDSLGRYRLTVGLGSGRWENEVFGCNGELVSATGVSYGSGGAQLDAWPTPHLRVTAFGGTFRPTPDSASSDVKDYRGPFGGGQLAFEGQHFGLGVGAARISGYDGFWAPSTYLRIGNMDGGYFRADVFPPAPVLGSTGWARAGVGFREGHRRGVGGFFGVALPPAYSQKAMVTGSLHFPVAGRLAVRLDGIFGPGESISQQGAAVALRYDFGSSRR